jgi:Protein of unknown function (DUF3466)
MDGKPMSLQLGSRIIGLSGFVALVASTAYADPLYNATALTAPNNIQPIVEGLDNNGQVLFWNPFAPAGAPAYSLYNAQAGGTITPLVSNDSSSLATQFVPQHISGNGQMIGWMGSQPVLSSGSQYTVLPGWGQAVNDAGQVAYENGQNSYIYSSSASRNLGTIPGYETTAVSGINDSGQAAATGSHDLTGGGKYLSQPLFYDGQHLIPLGTFGGPNGFAVAINNNGDVIGSALNTSGAFVGFVSHSGGPLISLGTLTGSWESQPESINNNGQIVGAALGQLPTLAAATGGGAFLYQSGTLMDLNKLLSPSASNIRLVDAYAINDAGQIVAEGYQMGQSQPVLQVFLLTPAGQPIPPSPDPLIQTVPLVVPEPSALATFGLMLAGICARRWWNRSADPA